MASTGLLHFGNINEVVIGLNKMGMWAKKKRFYLTPNDIQLLKKKLRGVGDTVSVSVDNQLLEN